MRTLAVPIFLLLIAGGSPTWAANIYVAVDLGLLPGYDYESANGLNNSGQVVGTAYDIGGNEEAFLYSSGTGMVGLGFLPGESGSAAAGINNNGEVVGTVEGPGDQAFLYTSLTGMVALGLGSTSSVGIGLDDNGQVVGEADSPSQQAALYEFSTGWNNLDSRPGDSSVAFAINDSGQIVGWVIPPGSQFYPFLYTSATGMINLGTLPGYTGGEALDINNTGQIVGAVLDSSSTGNPQAFLYSSSTGMIGLGFLPGSDSTLAHSINDNGQVVGTATYYTDEGRAFVYADGVMTDLNYLTVGLSSGVTLFEALGINDSGQIIANGSDGHAYLLTHGEGPLPPPPPPPPPPAQAPEPATWLLMAPALGALVTHRRRSAKKAPLSA